MLGVGPFQIPRHQASPPEVKNTRTDGQQANRQVAGRVEPVGGQIYIKKKGRSFSRREDKHAQQCL